MLEDGVGTMREIDLGLLLGAGFAPPPLQRADEIGLDVLLERLERAEEEWGEAFMVPTILRRLVSQGRLGIKSGQGFYAYPARIRGGRTSRSSSSVVGPSRSHGWTARRRTRSRPRWSGRW